MMVPANRLLLLTALILLPAALAVAFVPGFLPLWGLLCLVLTLMALLDMQRGRKQLEAIELLHDSELSLAQEREGSLLLDVENPNTTACMLRIGIQFPPSFRSEEEIRTMRIPAQSRTQSQEWAITPTMRGQYSIDNFYLEIPSRFGLWKLRRTVPVDLTLRVYPNLEAERRQLAALFLNRGRLGIHAQRQIGKGREFEQLRDYQDGDSYEDIHWKATARRGSPVSKVYQLEKTQEVYIALDCSRLSARQTQREHGKGTEAQLDRLIRAAMALGLVAEKQGDLFGLITFSDHIHGFVRAKNGRDHFQVCRDALYRLEPRRVNPDFEELSVGIMQRLRRRALIIFLTNLDDPILSEQFEEQATLLSRRHLILVNSLIPPKAKPLFTQGDARSTEDIYDQLAGHLQWHDLQTLKKTLHREGITLNFPRYATLMPELVSQYIDVKQRQLI